MHIFDLNELESPIQRLDICRRRLRTVTSSYVWGRGVSDNMVFVSSEAINPLQPDGIHLGYSLHDTSGREPGATREAVWECKDARGESGDSLGISPCGETLGLVTRGHAGKHNLRLYDLRNRDRHGKATSAVPIIPAPRGSANELEVMMTLFASNSTLLALSRNDNTTHLYDRRFMEPEPLAILPQGEHAGEVLEKRYGVVEIGWCRSTVKQFGKNLAFASPSSHDKLRLTTTGIDGQFLVFS